MSKIEQVVKRTGAVVSFKRERIVNAIYRAAVAVGGRDRSIAEGLADQVIAMLEEKAPPGHIPHVEEIQDVVEKVLIENGHARTAKAYILYREERARQRRRKKAFQERSDESIPYRKLWEVLSWAVDHDLNSVERLNARIDRGEFPAIVRESDIAYEEDIATAAVRIQERCEKCKLVIVAGPSSSGKTTTTTKLEALLQRKGLSFVALNVDNYFVDRELNPKDEYGHYDYETPQALDLPLINEHLTRLIAGEEVRIPFYNFKTGIRTDNVTPMRLKAGDIILIDSLHGLYPDMTAGIPDEQKFRLYIETLLQMKGSDDRFIRWTDLRLMRRMVRDATYRALKPRETLEHWHYVRSSELRHIVPHANRVDYIVNGALPYELPIMCARLKDGFAQWVGDYRDDAERQDAFERAGRVYRLLQSVTPVEDDSPIPPTSLLREFIGGSAYQY
ncbi:MAG: response regulator SirA [Anaerolineae bacterium]|nr:MAG: response regulator SirA [Anaerolineae bacterium]